MLRWAHCPECGSPIVNTMASPDFVCVRCDTEYRFERVVRARWPVRGKADEGACPPAPWGGAGGSW